MKNQFFKDRNESIKNLSKNYKEEILSEEKLASLPQVLQKHFRLSGFVGKPIAMNADIIWEESFIKLKPSQNWKSLQTLQFNSVHPIMRTAFMKINSMFFAGKDLYKEGKGTMKGKVFSLFNVMNAKGKEISQSSLITSFSEMMMLSGYAFQDYVKWEEVDEQAIKGTLIDHDFKVSGIFHFDTQGKFSYFETNDRYFSTDNTKFEKRRFRAKIVSYKKIRNSYQPKKVSVSWLLDNGEYEYFKGTIERIEYNKIHYK